MPANPRWKPIATLHSPTARCPASSSARVTIPTGLVKSTIHASGLAFCTRDGDVEDDRNGPQRLRQTARTGGLLADAAALERPGLVLAARGLPTDAQLEQDRVRALDARVEVRRRA